MPNIPLSDLVYFNPDVPYNNVGSPFAAPISESAYLLFRVHKQPNVPKAMVLVSVSDDSNETRQNDIFITSIEINKEGTINPNTIEPNTINSNVLQGYYFYPFDSEGNIQLYDIYIVPKQNLNGFAKEQLDNYIPLTGVNNYLYPILGMPTEYFLNLSSGNQDNERISNLIKDGQFSTTYLDLPSSEEFSQGNVRYPITQVNDNTTYEVSSNQNYTSALFGDVLSINTFDGDPGLEASPKNYLRILATNINPGSPWVYRDIAFYFEPYFKFNDRSFVLSFCAINNNLDLTTSLPIYIGYQRFYGTGAVIEPRATFTSIPPIMVTNIWTKYTVIIDLPTNSDYVQMGNDTYVKILLRLPVNFNSFDLSITNIFLDYGSSDVYYPIDYEQTYPNDVNNYGKPIVNTSAGYIPLASRAGEIKQFIHPNDTETTILADGRVIYSNDVHYYNMIDPASGKNAIFRIPYSNTYGTGLYDLIGYQYGTGTDHFTCDSLWNVTWTADAAASGFDNIFYWNYSQFQPASNFITSFGDNSKIASIQLHNGQNVSNDLTINAFFEQNNNFKIWYGADSVNYLNTAISDVTNPLDDYYYKYNAVNVTYVFNVHGIEKRFESFTSASTNVYDDVAKYSILFPIEDYAINFNNLSPTQQLNRTFLYGDTYGSIDLNLIGPHESFDYSIPINYYTAISDTYNPVNVDALTLIVTKNKNTAYFPATVRTPFGNVPFDGIGPNNMPIVRIMENNGSFPTVNANYEISAVPADSVTNANPFFINTQYVNTYYQNPDYSWNQAIGTGTSLKKIKLFLATQNKAGFAIQFKSLLASDYYGLWFYAKSDATRTVITQTYVNNIPTTVTTVVPDNQFCFYFSNGFTPQPISGLIPPGTTFIPVIIIGTATNNSTFSQALEKAVNSYRVQIPNLQGCVLKGYGVSMFQNPETTTNDPVLAGNFRNNGSGFPKLNIYSDRYVTTQTQTTLGNTLQNALSLDRVHPENYFYLYNHISVC